MNWINNLSILKTGKHTPVIISRSTKSIDSKVEIRVVDYSDHSSLVSALRDVHTVIVTLYTADAKEAVGSQVALLKAAKEAGVKRFAPSEWGARVSFCVSLYWCVISRYGNDADALHVSGINRIILAFSSITRSSKFGMLRNSPGSKSHGTSLGKSPFLQSLHSVVYTLL